MTTILNGKTIAITGAGRGIGLAIARALQGHGAKVAIGDIDTELARKAAAELGGHGGFLDVRDRLAFAAFLDGAERALGPIDVPTNNAGTIPPGPFHPASAALRDTHITINLRGATLGCQLAQQ